MIYYGELIEDLNFVTSLFVGDNSSSKSYIYYQDKILMYEDTNLTDVNRKNNAEEIASAIIDKVLRRLQNETDLKCISQDLLYRIEKYVWEILEEELGEDAKWHQKQKHLKS